MKSTTTAFRTRGELSTFVEKMFLLFFRPRRKFVWDMLYGVMASRNVLLSGVVSALCEDITPKKTKDRLSRNLDAEGLAREVTRAVAEAGTAFVAVRTLVIIVPTEIRKDTSGRWSCSRPRGTPPALGWGTSPPSGGAIRDCMIVTCGNGCWAPVPLRF